MKLAARDFPKYLEPIDKIRYLVFTHVRGSDELVNVHNSGNRELAENSANFWDERMDTYYISNRELIRQETHRLKTITAREKLEDNCTEAIAHINVMVDEMNAR